MKIKYYHISYILLVINFIIWSHYFYYRGYNKGYDKFAECFYSWRRLNPVSISKNGEISYGKGISDDDVGVIIYKLFEKVRFRLSPELQEKIIIKNNEDRN